MVRILGCSVFQCQDVFSTVHEPLSVCSSDTHLFVATEQCFIHVYDLTVNGCPEVHKFPTASRVTQIYHSDIGDTLVCFEMEHTIKHVRVYNGWQLTSDLPMKVRFAGKALSSPSDDEEPARMVVSEIKLKNSPSCIALDPITARLAIVVGHHIMVYLQNQVLNNDYKVPVTDYYCHFEIPIEMKINSIAFCENYIAVSSKREVQVLQFSTEADKAIKTRYKKSKSKLMSVSETSLSDEKADEKTNEGDENGIDIDKHHFLWTPECLDSETNLDKEASDCKFNIAWFKNLHSCKFDRRRIDGEEMLNIKHSKQIVVKRPEGIHLSRKPLPRVTSCLYQLLKSSDIPLHSLQFIPICIPKPTPCSEEQDSDTTPQASSPDTNIRADVYISVANVVPSGGASAKQSLSSLCLFVSSGREGYLYQVKKEVTHLTTYSYTGECSKVMTTNHCIHAVTCNGLETYLSMAVPATLHDELRADNRHDALPPVNLETCLLSRQPFIGVQAATCTNQCVVLMSKVQDMEDWCLVLSHWSLYCLKTADAVSLYHEMMETGSRYQQLSPHAYLHLLQQAHLLLRSARLVDSQSHDTMLDDLIKESARMLAEEYASSKSSDWYLALPYFRLSEISSSEIISTQLQKGITLDGGITQGFQHWLEQTLIQKDIHRDTDLMGKLESIAKILPSDLRSLLPASIKQIQVI